MELELGFKITKAIDDIRSTDLRIAKDHGGLVFVARETETNFILTAHLKGYKRGHISININEDGTLLTIKGERQVQEMVLQGWVMQKKEAKLLDFQKMFKIPSEAILDKIKAKYNEEESTLTIYMPKHDKGITGNSIEELVEEGTNVISNNGDQMEGTSSPYEEARTREDKEHGNEEEDEDEDGKWRNGQVIQQGLLSSESEVVGESKEEDENEGQVGKMSKLFISPCFFVGSAFFASLVVLVVGLVRSKRQRNGTN